jgi:predicted DNA-binding protein (UPF0251 family)
MSPRPRNIKKIFDPPKFLGYKPYGYYGTKNQSVFILYEEYTALRLCDYELMTQSEASREMQISRPTFTRLYESARRKIAMALAEARTLEVEKGQAYFEHDWLHCYNCNVFFTVPGIEFDSLHCPVCKSENIKPILSD